MFLKISLTSKKKKEKKISLKSSWFTMLSLTSPIQQSDSVDLVLISLWRKFPILSLSIVLDPFVECSSLDTSYLYSSYIYPPSKIAPSNCFVFLFNIHEIFETLFTSVLWFSAKSTTSKFIRYAMCGWISLAIQLPLASYFLNFELLVLLNTLCYKVLLYLENSAGNYVFLRLSFLPDMVLGSFLYALFISLILLPTVWLHGWLATFHLVLKRAILFRPPVCSKSVCGFSCWLPVNLTS